MKLGTSMWSRYDLMRLILPRQFFSKNKLVYDTHCCTPYLALSIHAESVGKAKSGLGPMFGFAAAAYIAVFIAFVLLVIDTSKNYVNEVTIMSSDLTGKELCYLFDYKMLETHKDKHYFITNLMMQARMVTPVK